MASEGNDYGTGYQPSEPKLCENGCGFFGTAATNGLCSKCYRDLRLKEEQAAMLKLSASKSSDPVIIKPEIDSSASKSSDPAVFKPEIGSWASKPSDLAVPAAANRCANCRKKVGMLGFTCRCGCTFCGSHRYPEQHGCTFDFKGEGRDAIAKANPLIKADKIERF